MRKIFATCVSVMVLFCVAMSAKAQEKNEPTELKPTAVADNKPQPSQSKPNEPADNKPKPSMTKPVRPYRLDFSLNELQDGRRTNTRHYSLNLTAGSSDEIKIGTRVPVRSSSFKGASEALVATQFQYLDVGTNIWAFLREVGDELQLEVRGEVSDLDKGPDTDLAPIVRQMKISGTTLLVTGKPIVISSMDDPNSNRQFQLEVTATKLR
ncbi:MAG TPA: hypothetical protein VH596_12280 [Terriglobales bacterium]